MDLPQFQYKLLPIFSAASASPKRKNAHLYDKVKLKRGADGLFHKVTVCLTLSAVRKERQNKILLKKTVRIAAPFHFILCMNNPSGGIALGLEGRPSCLFADRQTGYAGKEA